MHPSRFVARVVDALSAAKQVKQQGPPRKDCIPCDDIVASVFYSNLVLLDCRVLPWA